MDSQAESPSYLHLQSWIWSACLPPPPTSGVLPTFPVASEAANTRHSRQVSTCRGISPCEGQPLRFQLLTAPLKQ